MKEIMFIIEETNTSIESKITELFDGLQLDINSNEYSILETIYNNEGFYQSKLSKIILKERSMITRSLNKLEKLGFIERLVGLNKNRLVKRVFITQKGKNVIEDNQKKLTGIFNNFLSVVSDDEFANLVKNLKLLKDSLK